MTMQILGYGEDAFTLWILKHNPQHVLRELGDPSDPSQCLAFFRPSFGRSSKGKCMFGEFDCILASSSKIYLIESKWDHAKNGRKKTVKLDLEQIERHRRFSWYLSHWDIKHRGNWDAFREDVADSFRHDFPACKLVPTKSLCRKNLELALARLHEHQADPVAFQNPVHVLLYFYGTRRKGIEGVTDTDDLEFHPVNFDYSTFVTGTFIDLTKPTGPVAVGIAQTSPADQ
jgi:hypothetical protein